MHVSFIGLGLIAGAIAQALRSNEAAAGWTMAAWSPSGRGPRQAYVDGVIDVVATTPEEALAGAELVVLAGPATACLSSLDALAGTWSQALDPTAVVTDVASTKSMIVDRANATGIRFVGGHPMAGLETAGYRSGTADLFVGRPWVIVPGSVAGPTDIGRVADLANACSAIVTIMDADTHDRAVSAISHLPLIVAAALVESVTSGGDGPADLWPIASSLAAGGWRDTTRVALGDPSMGAAIAVTNASELAARVRDLRDALDRWIVELERAGGPDEEAIRDRLMAARAAIDTA
ncbi:MAG: prephenate dehydrogenase/arogenate dehydrogenase family protein [Thermomicrobiales bacterium]|nr:MAG: prephenate dehydrogenase/arogenate dehydrogenase family protein [Thermomicrobiales bacterium]